MSTMNSSFITAILWKIILDLLAMLSSNESLMNALSADTGMMLFMALDNYC